MYKCTKHHGWSKFQRLDGLLRYTVGNQLLSAMYHCRWLSDWIRWNHRGSNHSMRILSAFVWPFQTATLFTPVIQFFEYGIKENHLPGTWQLHDGWNLWVWVSGSRFDAKVAWTRTTWSMKDGISKANCNLSCYQCITCSSWHFWTNSYLTLLTWAQLSHLME